MGKKKILIIDDSVMVTTWVTQFLSQVGYETSSRDVAIGARAAILRENPDLVLMDINMPALQGDDIIRDFRRIKSGRNVRIVLHSSLDSDELARRAEACGADGFIQKTHDPREFILQIEKYLCDLPQKPKKAE